MEEWRKMWDEKEEPEKQEHYHWIANQHHLEHEKWKLIRENLGKKNMGLKILGILAGMLVLTVTVAALMSMFL